MGFLALSIEPDLDEVRAARDRLGLGVQVAVTRDEVLAPFGVSGVPSTIFVNAEGRIVGAATGERSAEFFRKHARALAGTTIP